MAFEEDCMEFQGLDPTNETFNMMKPFEGNPQFLKKVNEKTLFYMFYNLPFDRE
jgi:hypothetical protein